MADKLATISREYHVAGFSSGVLRGGTNKNDEKGNAVMHS